MKKGLNEFLKPLCLCTLFLDNRMIHFSGSSVNLSDCDATDIELVCDNGVINSSQVILASISKWLQSMLLESEADNIVLPGVSVSDVTALLSLATKGEYVVVGSTIANFEALRQRLNVHITVIIDQTVLHNKCDEVKLCKYQCGASFQQARRLKKHLRVCKLRPLLTNLLHEVQVSI